MKIKHLKHLLDEEVKHGKQVYVKLLVLNYNAKPQVITVDYNKSSKHFDELGLPNFTGHEYPVCKLHLKNGVYTVKPARAYVVKVYEIKEESE